MKLLISKFKIHGEKRFGVYFRYTTLRQYCFPKGFPFPGYCLVMRVLLFKKGFDIVCIRGFLSKHIKHFSKIEAMTE